MGKLTILLIVLLGWLQYSLWLGKNGMQDFVRIQGNIKIQRMNNEALKLRNNQLIAEIHNLSDGSDAIEERARNELGMIKPNENFYRMIPEQPNYSVKP